MSSSIRTLTVITGLLIPAPALTQQLEEIEIIGRRVNLVGSASSASEGRISHDELQLRPLLRTGEILESVPGLVATQHSGSGKANQFFLRGFNLDHGTDFATFIDGMPVNMRSHGHGQGYTDLNFIIPEMVEEIAYRKGSHYAGVGDFSGAGSAQISTLAHSDENQISLGAGENGFQRLLVAGGAGSFGGTLFYGAEYQRYAGPWDVVDEDVDKVNLWLKQQWETGGDSLSLTLMAYDNSWNSADQIPARAVESGLITPLGSIDPTVGGDSSRYSLSANWTREYGDSQWSASAYVIDYDMNLWSNFTFFIDPAGDQFQQVDERLVYGGQARWRRLSSVGERQMINTAGVELRVDDIDRVGLFRTAQRRFLGNIRLDKVNESSLGAYWENEIQWTARLRSVLGLRYDWFDFEVKPLAAADPATLLPNSGNSDDGILSPTLNLIYAIAENYELYAGLGRSFHSNDARGVTIRFDPVTGESVLPADPLVATDGSEIGLRVFLTDRLNASLALWRLDVDSELIFAGDAGNTEDTGVGSERTGVELTAYYQVNDVWALDLEYAYTNAEFVQPVDGSTAIAGALENVVSGGVKLRPTDRFNAYLRFRHFGDYPLDGGARAAGSTMVNLRMQYEISGRFDVTLDLLNLFDSNDHDVEYFFESRLPGEPEPVADHHFHVFEPRSARLYLNYRF